MSRPEPSAERKLRDRAGAYGSARSPAKIDTLHHRFFGDEKKDVIARVACKLVARSLARRSPRAIRTLRAHSK
jgi:hypothetical protein